MSKIHSLVPEPDGMVMVKFHVVGGDHRLNQLQVSENFVDKKSKVIGAPKHLCSLEKKYFSCIEPLDKTMRPAGLSSFRDTPT